MQPGHLVQVPVLLGFWGMEGEESSELRFEKRGWPWETGLPSGLRMLDMGRKGARELPKADYEFTYSNKKLTNKKCWPV